MISFQQPKPLLLGCGYLYCTYSINACTLLQHKCTKYAVSPDNRISGGKILSSRVRKGSNRVASALRHAAESIGKHVCCARVLRNEGKCKQKDAPLFPFFQRIMCRKGRCAAIIATARKLAVIIWTMLTKKVQFIPYDTTEIENQIREKQVKKINKLLKVFDVKAHEINFAYI